MEQFININSNNFASVLNKANNIQELVNDICENALLEGKVITEMIVKEQQNKTTLEEVRKNVEVVSVPIETFKNIYEDIKAAGTMTDEDYDDSIEKVKEKMQRYFISGTRENEILKAYDSTHDNKMSVENQLGLSKTEMDRLMGTGKYEDAPFGSYEFMKGGAKEQDIDLNILEKFRNCHIKDENGNYIFRDFLILDKDQTALKTNNLSFLEIGLVKNFGGQVKGNNFDILNVSLNMKAARDARHKKIGSAKFRLLTRVSGMKQEDEQMNQYTKQITQPVHTIKQFHKGSEFFMGGVFDTGRGIVNSPKKLKLFAKTLEIRNLEKKLRLGNLSPETQKKILSKLVKSKKELEDLKELFNKRLVSQGNIGKVAHYIYNPHEAVALGTKKGVQAVAKKAVNSQVGKKVTKKTKEFAESALGRFGKKVYSGLTLPFRVLKGARDKAFGFTGNLIFNNPLAKLLKRFFKSVMTVVKFAALPLVVFIIIFLIVSFMGEANRSNQGAIIIMPLSKQSDFDNYQLWYNNFDDEFMKSLENFVQNQTINTNVKGDHIFYGVNGMNNEDGMKNNDFQNGLYYKYITDEEHEGRSSNIEDLIAMMAIMMSQQQSTLQEESKEVLNWLYNLSHTYTYQESALYPCDSGCHNIEYKCIDKFHDYNDSDLKYNPFHALRKSGGEYEIIEPTISCPVCSKISNITSKLTDRNNCYDSYINSIIEDDTEINEEDYMWCSENSTSISTCYHGHFQASVDDEHYLGTGRPSSSMCDNPVECEYEIVLSNGDTITRTYYACGGHEHKTCNGHNYKCCTGHIDMQMNINIKFYEELKDLVNKYDFGTNDHIAKLLSEDD